MIIGLTIIAFGTSAPEFVVTISAALALGLDSKIASRFSFLLAVPTIGAIACYQIIGVDFSSFADEYKTNLIGMVVSFVIAYLTIDFLPINQTIGISGIWSAVEDFLVLPSDFFRD